MGRKCVCTFLLLLHESIKCNVYTLHLCAPCERSKNHICTFSIYKRTLPDNRISASSIEKKYHMFPEKRSNIDNIWFYQVTNTFHSTYLSVLRLMRLLLRNIPCILHTIPLCIFIGFACFVDMDTENETTCRSKTMLVFSPGNFMFFLCYCDRLELTMGNRVGRMYIQFKKV